MKSSPLPVNTTPFRKILLCTHDATNRYVLEKSLDVAGLNVIATDDELSMLRLARGERPAVIVLDVDSPGHSGLDIAKQLINETRTHSIPIILLMAGGDEILRIVALELGVDDCLTKPVNSRELILRIQRALSRGEDRRAADKKAKGSATTTDDSTVSQPLMPTLSAESTHQRIPEPASVASTTFEPLCPEA